MKNVKTLLAASGLVFSVATAGCGLAGCTSKETDGAETRTSRTSATTVESSESTETSETSETTEESGVTEDTTGAASSMTDSNQSISGWKEIKWQLSSFDGGGPQYDITFEDDTIATYSVEKKYHNPDHDKMTGSPFTYTYIFKGVKPGTTKMTVEETLQGGSLLEDRKYYIVTVCDDLTIIIAEDKDAVDPDKMPVFSVGDREIKVVMEKNATAQEFLDRQNTLFSLGSVKDVNGNEKSCWIAEKIHDDEIATVEVQPGDIIRYGSMEFAIVYKAHTIDCVVIGHLEDITEEELTSLLSDEEAEKTFYVPIQ